MWGFSPGLMLSASLQPGIGVRRSEGISQERPDVARIRAKGEQQEAAGKREVLEKVPEQTARPAIAGLPEIARLPELLPEQCRHHAVASHNQGGEPVRRAGQDAKRHDDLDEKPSQD